MRDGGTVTFSLSSPPEGGSRLQWDEMELGIPAGPSAEAQGGSGWPTPVWSETTTVIYTQACRCEGIYTHPSGVVPRASLQQRTVALFPDGVPYVSSNVGVHTKTFSDATPLTDLPSFFQ